MPLAERVINIDDLLIADAFLANIEEAKNHYDVRSIISTELGRALAYAYDKRSLQAAVLAARSANTVTGIQGGTALINANYGTIGSTLAAGIFQANQTFDEKDVPPDERYFYCRPAQYYLLAQTTEVLNRDWGGSGAYAEGSVLKVAGIGIVKGNHLPITNISAVTGEQNTYNGNFSTTVGVAWHKSAIGTVKLLDLSMESEYQVWRQGTLMVAKYALGIGVLRPEAAVELKTA